MLGLAALSRSPHISSTPPSEMPVIFRVREVSRPPPTMSRRRGRTWFSHMWRSSRGGPGIETSILPSFCVHQPGAVPIGLGMAEAEGMSMACLMLFSGMVDAPVAEEAADLRLAASSAARAVAVARRRALRRGAARHGGAGEVVVGGAEAAGHEEVHGRCLGGRSASLNSAGGCRAAGPCCRRWTGCEVDVDAELGQLAGWQGVW